MRHDAPLRTMEGTTSLRAELADYLRASGSPLSMPQAAALAVRAWIAADRAAADRAATDCAATDRAATDRAAAAWGALKHPVTARLADLPAALETTPGYLWKTVFLPHGTQLRMEHGGHTHTAQVIGHEIRYQNKRVSPRGMTLAVTGNGRNAWRDLVILFPGARHWKRASCARIDIACEEANGRPRFFPHQRGYKKLQALGLVAPVRSAGPRPAVPYPAPPACYPPPPVSPCMPPSQATGPAHPPMHSQWRSALPAAAPPTAPPTVHPTVHPTAHQTVPPTVPPAALRQPTVAHQLAQALARLAHDDGPAPQYVPGPHDPDRRREGQGRRSDDLADTCSYD